MTRAWPQPLRWPCCGDASTSALKTALLPPVASRRDTVSVSYFEEGAYTCPSLYRRLRSRLTRCAMRRSMRLLAVTC